MSLTDPEVVASIKREAEHIGLSVGLRRHGGSFCTVYMEAPVALPRAEQRSRLAQAKSLLDAAGVSSVKLTAFNNPPFHNRHTNTMEDGHPRHGDPMLEIESVWWPREEGVA